MKRAGKRSAIPARSTLVYHAPSRIQFAGEVTETVRFRPADDRPPAETQSRALCAWWPAADVAEQHQQHGGGEGCAARHIEVHHTCTFRTQRCLH